MALAFLWSGVGPGEWLAQVVAQTLVAFALIGAVLTPLWKRGVRWYRQQIDPYSRGGSGEAVAPDGRAMHEYLKSTTTPPSTLPRSS